MMTKQIHTVNPCSKCGKDIQELKHVIDGLPTCNQCYAQEWLKQELRLIGFKFNEYKEENNCLSISDPFNWKDPFISIGFKDDDISIWCEDNLSLNKLSKLYTVLNEFLKMRGKSMDNVEKILKDICTEWDKYCSEISESYSENVLATKDGGYCLTLASVNNEFNNIYIDKSSFSVRYDIINKELFENFINDDDVKTLVNDLLFNRRIQKKG